MLADRYHGFVLDLDGTLYRGDAAIPGAPETVARLREAGKPVVFLTNNSGRTRREIAERLAGFGIEAGAEEVVSSAVATAELLASRGARTVYALCGAGLREELTARGIEVADGRPSEVDAVVVGWDPDVTYERLKVAGLLVQAGAPLVASNADAAYPAADGLWPGSGALLAVITTTTGATPEIVGKPQAPLFRAASAHLGVDAPLMVGDRLDTDIAGAAALGWDTLLVLTGISGPGDVRDAAVRPTYVVDDLSALFAEPEPVANGSR